MSIYKPKNVQRFNLAGTAQEVKLNNRCTKILIKNWGQNPIYVSFDEEVNEATSYKIGGEHFQVIITNNVNNVGNISPVSYSVDKIYIKGSGEVEVDEVEFTEK